MACGESAFIILEILEFVMLVSLRMTNFVLMDDTRIEFHPGLNCVTGETGAGKSIMVDALSLLLGERASSEAVRNPDRDAMIEAEFEIADHFAYAAELRQCLHEAGIQMENGFLLIQRHISREGRSRIFLNNTQCLLKKLRDIGDLLIDLHGQHEHQSLLHKSAYLPLLDSFGTYGSLLDKYRKNYVEWTAVQKQLHAMEEDERERKRKEATLQFQIEEIDKANISVEEDERIESRLQVIQHGEKLVERCAEVLKPLAEGEDERGAILDELDRMESVLAGMEQIDTTFNSVVENWRNAIITLKETARDLEDYAQNLDFDPQELDRLQQRYFLLKDLKAKYGSSLAEVLAYREEMETELLSVRHREEERSELGQKEESLRAVVAEQAGQLHEARKKVGKTIAKKVTTELQKLGMKQAKFTMDCIYRAERGKGEETASKRFGPDGADDVEFLVTTIPDKPPRPLREVASGGEVSRIMLALKCVFGEADPVPTMVFDEIDVGVGGETADVVGDRLAMLAEKKQVLCITHLPPIASRGHYNLHVRKEETNGRLQSTVVLLKGKERENELARMLGGGDSTATRRLARELLKTAQR